MPATKPSSHLYEPEMRVTRYDSIRATLVALLLGFSISSAIGIALFAMLRPQTAPTYVPIDLADADGGFEDGRDEDTPDVQNEAPPRPDAAPVEIETETLELQETLETLTDLSTEAAQMLPEQVGETADNAGPLGSSDGGGGRPLGIGGGSGGVPREKRWLVRFGDRASVDEYARQLDYFKIELGVITGDGKLVFANKLSGSVPQTREVVSGEGEERLYFQWQGGPRRVADRTLFSKAGIDPGRSPILHFYDKGTENQLAQLEYVASNKVDVRKIRRTFFDVLPVSGGGYEFKVAQVVLLKPN